MKSKYIITVLSVHLILLLLAATKFSVVSYFLKDGTWTCNYFSYSFQSGWGYRYQSDYSLWVVLAYLAAFVIGVLGFIMAFRRISAALSVPAVILCLLGMISFSIEGSHWIWDHNESWIVIAPVVSFALGLIAIFQLSASDSAASRSTSQLATGSAIGG